MTNKKQPNWKCCGEKSDCYQCENGPTPVTNKTPPRVYFGQWSNWQTANEEIGIIRHDLPKLMSNENRLIELVEKSYYDTLQAELDELKKNWKELELEQVKHIEIITEQYHSRLERAESLLKQAQCIYVKRGSLQDEIDKYFAEAEK